MTSTGNAQMGAPARPVLLVLIAVPAPNMLRLQVAYDVLHAPDAQRRSDAVRDHGARVQAVLTNGAIGVRVDEIDAMPGLTLICTLGAGYENVPVEHARARGIVLANGAGTNDDCVADHALALLLAVLRAVPAFDAACRAGVWRDALPMRPQLAHRRVGILGLGNIGRKIARRLEGFDAAVGYHNRTRRGDVSYLYFDTLRELAEWSDVLVVAVPGGAATRHLVNAGVLKAIGAGGYLVNIARGSIVDTEALAQAMKAGTLAGAALDTYESEPLPPAALLALSNVVLTPHVAGTSPEAKQAVLSTFLENAGRHFSGLPVRTAI